MEFRRFGLHGTRTLVPIRNTGGVFGSRQRVYGVISLGILLGDDLELVGYDSEPITQFASAFQRLLKIPTHLSLTIQLL